MKQLAAALIFFTRLPLWRVVWVPDACYRRVVAYWSATGWLTAAVTAGVLYGAAFLLPVPAAVLAAVIARVLLTGALHEDGLSDFLDGFGGGRTREPDAGHYERLPYRQLRNHRVDSLFRAARRAARFAAGSRWRVRQCFAAIRSASSSRR